MDHQEEAFYYIFEEWGRVEMLLGSPMVNGEGMEKDSYTEGRWKI
ncbi:MAG: hypothetical protein U9R75_06790 [Candidatus Thermoplasmatota archaeon]|nr:hypothetical protein [Candidatus Thermoplasmatota archaeon]